MKRLLCALGACALLVSAMGARAHDATVGPTCAALQSFSNDGSIPDFDTRIANGKAHLRDAEKAAKESGDRRLLTLTRRFRAAFTPAVQHPNKGSAQRALNEAGMKLWRYCSLNGEPIRRTDPSATPTTVAG